MSYLTYYKYNHERSDQLNHIYSHKNMDLFDEYFIFIIIKTIFIKTIIINYIFFN
jgi:hypothetical protein